MCCSGVLCCSAALLLCWKVVVPFLHMLFMFTFGKMLYSKRNQLKKAGEWAIVTGATAGIGKAYAQELAKDGLNVMLISIDEPGLKRLAEELRFQYNVMTKTVLGDFTRTDIYEMLEQENNPLPSIAGLVNNVGIGYPRLARFDDASFMDFNFIRNLINCNMNSMISLTRIVLPRLLKQTTNGSAIINLSSFAGLTPYPYMSLYGASKAFIQHFVKSLIPEVRNSTVIIQAVCPLIVATSLSGISKTSFFIPTPETYARSALDMLGVEAITVGYFPHALRAFIVSFFPTMAIRHAETAYKKLSSAKEE